MIPIDPPATEFVKPAESFQWHRQIDSLINQAKEKFQIPGMAVGIVAGGKIIFTKGYGVCDATSPNPTPINQDTLFAIGSCSKAFTTFALGLLVDAKKIAWNDPVIKHLPNFRLFDAYATHHLTIKDLVSHSSGLPRHDFVWYNASLASRYEILDRLPFLEPTFDLREKFQYNNIMYAVAGLVLEKVTHQTWEDFVQENIFDPLGMSHSNFSIEHAHQNSARPHTSLEGKIQTIPARDISIMGPAGSIQSSIFDMAKWVQLQLSDGELNGKKIINKKTLEEMHQAHMPVSSNFDESPYFFGYGLGWKTGLYQGCYMVTHDGGIDGFISSVVLLPKEKMGVVVLTNTDTHRYVPNGVANAIIDCFLNRFDSQWSERIEEKEKKGCALVENESESLESHEIPQRPLKNYLGAFEHGGYGTIRIVLNENQLVAVLNDLEFNLQYKNRDAFSAKIKSQLFSKMDCCFICDDTGQAVEFCIALEPELPPISFKRNFFNPVSNAQKNGEEVHDPALIGT